MLARHKQKTVERIAEHQIVLCPQDFDKKKTRFQRPIEEKESYKWLKSFEAVQQQTPETMLVSVGDRESDIYELFEHAATCEDSPHLLVRAGHDRNVDATVDKLLGFMASQPVAGARHIEVPRKKQQPRREAILDARFAKVSIKRPQNLERRDHALGCSGAATKSARRRRADFVAALDDPARKYFRRRG